mmetsp:Transcript_10672/g.29619  ORF Transcript_10672/g.29619 Transcript_10672/m.29619 type:complete len:277 (-) Transcript_10672:469-1299(-)
MFGPRDVARAADTREESSAVSAAECGVCPASQWSSLPVTWCVELSPSHHLGHFAMLVVAAKDAKRAGQHLRSHSIRLRIATTLPERQAQLTLCWRQGQAQRVVARFGMRTERVNVVLDAILELLDAAARCVKLSSVRHVGAIPSEILPVFAHTAAATLLRDARKNIKAHCLFISVRVRAAGNTLGFLATAAQEHIVAMELEALSIRVQHVALGGTTPTATPGRENSRIVRCAAREIVRAHERQIGTEPADGKPIERIFEFEPRVSLQLCSNKVTLR